MLNVHFVMRAADGQTDRGIKAFARLNIHFLYNFLQVVTHTSSCVIFSNGVLS
ncbi:hypothetical protein D3C80_2165690 [compost metagenome]